MKQLVIAWFALLALAFVLAGSCAIDHRSGAFECTKASDCDLPRTCSDGLCVLPGGAIDAPAGDAKKDGQTPDAFVCPSQCTSCNAMTKTCTIDCAAGANCSGPVVCPENWNCNIKCSTPDSCRSGINCTGGDSCLIACTGARSCRNINCGDGPCNVTCAATEACRNVNCGPSCACDIKCTNGAVCSGNICSAPQCSTGFGGCSSTQFPSCETCP
jgi:hypothetical protein